MTMKTNMNTNKTPPRAGLAAVAALALLTAPAAPALAGEDSYTLTIKDHRFQPAELEVPAGERLRLVVRNEDATPEEFESHDFNREKIIPGNSQAVILVGPLEPGTYRFFGEFHEDTAQGRLVVK